MQLGWLKRNCRGETTDGMVMSLDRDTNLVHSRENEGRPVCQICWPNRMYVGPAPEFARLFRACSTNKQAQHKICFPGLPIQFKVFKQKKQDFKAIFRKIL